MKTDYPNILQCGAPKSGNFWLYKILQQILTSSGKPTESFIERQPIYSIARTWKLNYPEQARVDVLEITDQQFCYRISSDFSMPINDLGEYARKTPHVWTHSTVCQKSGEVFDLFGKKIYIVRDPRDRALSAARYYCSDYMRKHSAQPESDPLRFLTTKFDQLMREWVWHVFDHLRLSEAYDIHITFYEGFLLDFQAELDRLLDYLDISMDPDQRGAIEEAVSFDTLKRKNPEHLKKGTSGYWMDQLTAQQMERTEQLAGPLIRHLGYPSEKDLPMTFRADRAQTDWGQLKQEILVSQAQLT